jgi:glutathione synthase
MIIKKIAFQMEHMQDTANGKTHSLLLIHEACLRGHDVFHYHPETVSISNDEVFAKVSTLHVDLSKEHFYDIGDPVRMELSAFDVIWFRQDPPYNISYVTNTLILDYLHNNGVLVTNNPFWIRNMQDKLSIFNYPEYLPPTLVSKNLDEIEAFLNDHKDIILNDYRPEVGRFVGSG